MKHTKIKITTLFIFTLLVVTGCEDSTGTPESATISGEITFIGTWPDTGNISISAMKIWNFMDPEYTGIPSGYQLILESQVSVTNGDTSTFDYTISNLPFSVFNGIAVSWTNPDTNYNSSCNQSVLGGYGDSVSYPFISLDSVVTSTTNHELSGLNINANFMHAIPNQLVMCQPSCTTLTEPEECEERNHCVWSNDQCTLIEQ